MVCLQVQEDKEDSLPPRTAAHCELPLFNYDWLQGWNFISIIKGCIIKPSSALARWYACLKRVVQWYRLIHIFLVWNWIEGAEIEKCPGTNRFFSTVVHLQWKSTLLKKSSDPEFRTRMPEITVLHVTAPWLSENEVQNERVQLESTTKIPIRRKI